MEPVFTVRSIIDRKLLIEAIWRKTRLFVIIMECFLFANLAFFAFVYLGACLSDASVSHLRFILFFALLLYLIFWTVYRNYSMVNRQLKQYQASFGQPSLELEYLFFEDSFQEHNLLSGSVRDREYQYLFLILRCKNQFLLRYNMETLFLTYQGISGGTAEELEAFLKSKIIKK